MVVKGCFNGGVRAGFFVVVLVVVSGDFLRWLVVVFMVGLVLVFEVVLVVVSGGFLC